MKRALLASAALALLAGTGTAHAQSSPATGMCHMAVIVPAGTQCSVGPLVFSGTCGVSVYSAAQGWADVAYIAQNPENTPLIVNEVFLDVVGSGNKPGDLSAFVGDSDQPDAITGQTWAQPDLTGVYHISIHWTPPAGVQGVSWLPGTATAHHIDAHVPCSQGSFTGALVIKYVAPITSGG